MLKEIKLLNDWEGYTAGTVLKVDEDTLTELVDAKTAEAHDSEAEAQAAETAEKERKTIVSEVATAVKEALKDEKPDAKNVRVEVGKDRETDKPWKSLGEFVQVATRASMPGNAPIDKRLVLSDEKVLTEGVNSAGGFLVPVEYSTEIMKRAYDRSAVMGRCRNIPMASNSIKIPTVAETSRADGSRAGGIRGYWIAESSDKTTSDPAFGQIEMNLHKLVILTYSSDELLDDANALSSLLGELAADEIAFKVDDAIINGTGAGQPLGILNSPCLVSVPKETGQAATTIVAENIIKMYSRLHSRSRGGAVWLVNQDCLQQLHQMALPVGTGGIPVYMPANGLSSSPYGTMYGRPVVEIEQCQTLGTAGDIYLADLSQYLLGQKSAGTEFATSIHYTFNYDRTAFRWVLRVDGQPWWASALTPKNGTNTVSPFINLAVRA